MVDTVTAERRSAIMSKIRAKGMKPEIVVRKLAHSMGYRYRLHRKDLPGKPDLVFGTRKKVIFVHGCFWHQHSDPSCKIARLPKSNQAYWLPKLKGNAMRDAKNELLLREKGWDVLVIWECETKHGEALASKIREFLDEAFSQDLEVSAGEA